MKRMTNQKGFTIIELLVVIVVIAILAGIVIVVFQGIQQRALESSMKSDAKNAASQAEADRTTTGSYPGSATAANGGLGLKASGNNSLTYELRPYGYCIVITNPGTTTSIRVKNPLGSVEAGDCNVNVSTPAGSGAYNMAGFADGSGTSVQFDTPWGVTVDREGNVYVADRDNNRIRKITPAGVVSTFAGSGTAGAANGTGSAATFNQPRGIEADAEGNLYVADTGNHLIRKITPSGVVTTLAGSIQGFLNGNGTAARFNVPIGITVDSSGNVYVADTSNRRIRMITPTGDVTTFSGNGTNATVDGPAASAQFQSPNGITIDTQGNFYVSDSAAHRIRKLTSNGTASTLAGSGTAGYTDATGTAAQFNSPGDVAVDIAGNVYVADLVNYRIRKITPSGVVTTYAGSPGTVAQDGIGTEASFNFPQGIAINSSSTLLYVADRDNHVIRKVEL